jgi:rhodanese-related sulfurtransferase
MNWILPFLIVLVFAAFVIIKHLGQISEEEARTLLLQGAIVVDVRTAGEFMSGHLPTAINLPLNDIEADIADFVRSKDQIILLHCHSGVRSGLARKRLKALGYTHVFNLGSLERATSIVSNR